MDLFNRQLDLGLDLDYDKKEQETKFQKRLKVFKLKYAIKFNIIKYSCILQSVNVLIHWSSRY